MYRIENQIGWNVERFQFNGSGWKPIGTRFDLEDDAIIWMSVCRQIDAVCEYRVYPALKVKS